MKKALIALFLALIFATTCCAEELTEAWILCQPDSRVNVRTKPKKSSAVSGYLYMGDRIFLDGEEKYGFVHCVDLGTEAGEGWVSEGFVIYSEPRPIGHDYCISAKGRVACRRSKNGSRRQWVRDGDIVRVYMAGDGWCLTNCGFIKSEFVDLNSRQDILESSDPNEMTWEED